MMASIVKKSDVYERRDGQAEASHEAEGGRSWKSRWEEEIS
jgi:hypothetical protein